MPNRHGAPLQEPVVGAAQWMWMVGDHRAEHGWFENGILQTFTVCYGKSPFFICKLCKITIFHGYTI